MLLKAKSQDTNVPRIYYAKDLYYHNLGIPDIAKRSYEKALRMGSDDFKAYNFYAKFLCMDKPPHQQANNLFQRSIVFLKNINLAETFRLYRRYFLQQGNNQEAKKYCEKAIDQGTVSTLSCWESAQTKHKKKDYKNALNMLNLYVEPTRNPAENIKLKIEILKALGNYNKVSTLYFQLSSKLY